VQRSTVPRTGVTGSGPFERIPRIENYQSPLSEPGHPVRVLGRLPREGAIASPGRKSGEMGNLTTWGPPEKRGTARLHLSVSAGLGPILFTLSFFSVGSGFEPAAGLRPGVRLNAGWKPGGSTEVLPHELSKQYWV